LTDPQTLATPRDDLRAAADHANEALADNVLAALRVARGPGEQPVRGHPTQHEAAAAQAGDLAKRLAVLVELAEDAEAYERRRLIAGNLRQIAEHHAGDADDLARLDAEHAAAAALVIEPGNSKRQSVKAKLCARM